MTTLPYSKITSLLLRDSGFGECEQAEIEERKRHLSQEFHNMISAGKIFAQGFLLRPGSSVSNTYSKSYEFPLSRRYRLSG